MSNADPISLRVVRGVAAREGVDPLELEPPLHEVIDTDALDALFRSTDESATAVEFTYRGHRVCVDGTGEIELTTASADCGESTALD